MRCKQWTRRLTYTTSVLTLASSLILMLYIHTSIRARLRNESFPVGVDEGTIQNDSIPLVDFRDSGNGKRRVLLLVTTGSAPQRYDRRQAIRATWWKHCKLSLVNKSIGLSWGWIQINLDISECQGKKKLSVDTKEVRKTFVSFRYGNSSVKLVINDMQVSPKLTYAL